MRFASLCLALIGLLSTSGTALAGGPACQAASAATLTPVIELYTSEGCSSCPPADRWLSGLKQSAAKGAVVAQAFHVGYWDYIGWVDRFASPAYTARQKQVALRDGLSGIYTPQLVRNGRDSRDYLSPASAEAPQARIVMRRDADDTFEASVEPTGADARWSAYWSVTEHGHSSKVRAGENAGESLQHDFVVRQYVPAGDYRGPANLVLRALPAQPQHPRQVNLVVFDKASGKPLQALSLGC
jgi:hypothetical protein